MIPAARLGILGGTLDPVHTGHVDTALAARRALDLDVVVLMPSHVPPHRHHPVASPYHRFAMAALAVNGIAGLEASEMELAAPGPTYTSDTLRRLHGLGLQPAQIFFITGADAFAEIATWNRYPEVLDQAHFVVVSRPGHPVDGLPRQLPALAERMRPPLAGVETLKPAIFLVDARTTDISSTELRRRLGASEPVRGLIPPAVLTHIEQHHLYSQTGSGRLISTADHLHGKD